MEVKIEVYVMRINISNVGDIEFDRKTRSTDKLRLSSESLS